MVCEFLWWLSKKWMRNGKWPKAWSLILTDELLLMTLTSNVLSRSVTGSFWIPARLVPAYVRTHDESSVTSRFVLRRDSPHVCHFCDGYKLRLGIPSADVTNHTFAHFTTQRDSYSKNVQNMLIDTTRCHVQNFVITGWEMNRQIEKCVKSTNEGGGVRC